MGARVTHHLQLLVCLCLLLQHTPSTRAAPVVSSTQAGTTNKSTTATAAATAPTAYKWTIFIYMVADNDLECFALDDMMVRPLQ